MPLDEKETARLQAFRNKQAEAENASQENAERRELEIFDLVETLEKDFGKRGEGFEIVDNPYGLFAVKRPDTQATRNWEKATDAQHGDSTWNIGLLKHYIIPADRQLAWAQLAAERAGVWWQTAGEFVKLMGLDRKLLAKK